MNLWLKEAEDRGAEASDFADWVDANENKIIDRYVETVEIDDVPDNFIEDMYTEYLQGE